jgi:hypothetical protein
MSIQFNTISDDTNVFATSLVQDEEKDVALIEQEGKCTQLFHERGCKSSHKGNGSAVQLCRGPEIEGRADINITWGDSKGPTFDGKVTGNIRSKDGTSIRVEGSGGTDRPTNFHASIEKDQDQKKDNDKGK